MYILGSNNELSYYRTASFVKEKSIILDMPKKKKYSLVASEKIIYIAVIGETKILCFDAKTLAPYKPIKTKNPIADIGLAGNLVGIEINNH